MSSYAGKKNLIEQVQQKIRTEMAEIGVTITEPAVKASLNGKEESKEK